jgi:hypothetical protein
MRLYRTLSLNRPDTEGMAIGCQFAHVRGLGLVRFWKADIVT